jgi:hypothetical protein
MKCKFIGRDGSMGLRTGTIYDVEMFDDNIVIIYVDNSTIIRSYAGGEAFFNDWEVCDSTSSEYKACEAHNRYLDGLRRKKQKTALTVGLIALSIIFVVVLFGVTGAVEFNGMDVITGVYIAVPVSLMFVISIITVQVGAPGQ